MASAKLPQVRLQHMLETIDEVLAVTNGRPIGAIVEYSALIRATERRCELE